MANSAVVGALRVLLSADTAQFEKALKGADANVQKLANTMKRDLEPSQARINSLVRSFLGSKEIGMAESYAKAVKEIGGAAKLTANDQARVNKVVQEALAHYKALGQTAPKHLLDLANATKQVHAPTQQLGGNLDMLLGKARTLAGMFGVTLGAAAIGSFIKSTFTAAEQINDLALKMGVSIEAAQRFQYAARQSGADIDDVSRAIVKMSDSLVEGDKSTVSALSSVGLKFSEIRALKPEDAFRRIADAIQRIPDPMLQAQVALELFGKSGAQLLPMIREGSLKAADSVAVMSSDTVKALEEAKQAWENFGNALTVITGSGISQILEMVKALKELTLNSKLLTTLAMAAVGPVNFAMMVNATSGMGSKTDPHALPPGLTLGQTGPLGLQVGRPLSKAEQDERDRKARDAAAAERRFNELYQAFRREQLTGLTDSQRQVKQFQELLRSELGLTSAFSWGQSIVSKTTDWSRLLTGGKVSIPVAPAPTSKLPVAPMTNFKALTAGGLDLDDLLRGVKIPPPTFGQQFTSTMGMVPQTIMQALTGGGNVAKSIGGLFGGGLTGELGKTISTKLAGSFLGKTLGGALGSVIPGLGTLLGSGLGSLVGKLGSLGQNTSKGTREDFAKQLGFTSLDALYGQLQQMGAAGSALANTGLNMLGKKDKAGTEAWMKQVSTFLDTVPKKFAALTQAVQAFGGVAPKSVQPLINQLLASNKLTEEMRKQLIAMSGAPAWEIAAERAQALGVDPSMLGSGFNQSRVAATAFQLQHDIELFERFNANLADFLPGVADELSALTLEAIKTGAALPKTLEPYLKKLDAMGLLLDENGTRIDMGALSFKDIEDEALKQVVSVLEDIRDLLAGKLPDAVRKFGAALGTLPEMNLPRMPRQLDDFSMSLINAVPNVASDLGQSMTVVLEQDGRATARWLVPYIPNEVQRLRLAP